jgi:predicted nucleic acid-binding protein
MALGAKIHGGVIHDARVAAICVEHGVTQLWTLDRDFSRFPAIRTDNPLMK